jgi:hypothetical protein
MIRKGDVIAIFNNIHQVMKAEKVLKARRLDILLIPVPRSLQSDCGLAIRYAEADREQVEGVMMEADLLPEELYMCRGEDFVRIRD